MSNNSVFKGLDINMLQKKKVSELHIFAKELGVMAAGLRKEELIFKIILGVVMLFLTCWMLGAVLKICWMIWGPKNL